jgi:hypothetical protein
LEERFDGINIWFYKMKTEVEEFGVLKVAKEIIMSFKPKLAITVYHSLKDFWGIPEWLDSIEFVL